MGGRVVGFGDDTSECSSSSGRSSVPLSGRGRSPVPRWILLKRRVLGIQQYVAELRCGGNASLSNEQRRRLYGGSVVPVAVPLLPGESEADHERSCVSWLRDRGYTLASLRDDPNKERSLRTAFAKSKASAWSRGEYDNERAPSASTGKRSRASDDEDEEYDDTASADEWSAKRVRRDGATDVGRLLRTRVLTVEEFREEESYGYKPIGSASRRDIPVPLFPGETVEEYERHFQAYLGTVSMDVSRLASEPNTERSIRMTFARKRLTGDPPPPLQDRTRATQIALSSPLVSSRPSILSRVSDPVPADHHSTESKSCDAIADSEPSQPIDPLLVFPAKCTLRRPPPESDDTAIPKAYLACGCRKCLLRCTSRLVRQVAGLQSDLADSQSTTATSSETSDAVMDLTRDTDSQASGSVTPGSARGAQTTSGIDVAKMLHMMTLIKSRRRGRSINTTRSSRESTTDDPIEQQLQRQYDEVNERVVENERVLETASLELQGAALSCHDQLQEASMTQDENLELRAYIEEEKDHRDAALAMLVVYTWRHACGELQERLAAPAAADVPHVTRACHRKCAFLASELSGFETQAASVRQQLDVVLSGESREEHETRRLEQLQRLGEELTRVEQAMQANHATRKRELATLLHFDGHVRRLVQELLREAT